MEQLAVIKPEEFGLTVERASGILTSFAPKEIEFKALVQRYSEILTMDIEEALPVAKDLKKEILAFEKSVNGIHKVEKEFYWNGGKFVDAQKNRFIVHVSEWKKRCDEIIKHKELAEKREQERITQVRREELEKYMESVEHLDLTMSEDVYQAFKSVKIKEWEQEQQRRGSDKIIAKIYQPDVFDEFDTELFGEHIEERKKQINQGKLLTIANYNGGELGFELDSEELQQAYSERLKVLDSIRVERIKSEMQRLYNSVVNVINTDILSFEIPAFDAQEFTREWQELNANLTDLHARRREFLASILMKMPDSVVMGKNVMLPNEKVFCTIDELTHNSIEDFNFQVQELKNATLNADELFQNWVNSFVAPGVIDDARCAEVIKNFEGFKKWASSLKLNK